MNNEILEENKEQNETELLKDKTFDQLKNGLIEEQRLLKRFYEFSYEHGNFEYDESGINDDEGDDLLRKANKIRDKILDAIAVKKMYLFSDVQTNTLSSIITSNLEVEGKQFSCIIEVSEDGFNLELI